MQDSILESCIFDFAVGGTLHVARGNRLFFIVGVFTAAKRDFHLDERAFEIHFQGYERITLAVDFACDFRDFTLVQ